jgi:hypothetical protein
MAISVRHAPATPPERVQYAMGPDRTEKMMVRAFPRAAGPGSPSEQAQRWLSAMTRRSDRIRQTRIDFGVAIMAPCRCLCGELYRRVFMKTSGITAALPAQDLGRAEAFYIEKVGLPSFRSPTCAQPSKR